MAEIELRGDRTRRELVTALARTYATPLDRDDIFALSRRIDDVIDAAQDALLTLTVFGTTWSGHAEEMARALAESAETLAEAVTALPGARAQLAARKTKRYENIVVTLYRYGVDLALRQLSVVDALRLREVYAALLHVAHTVGAAADLIADVAVKEK